MLKFTKFLKKATTMAKNLKLKNSYLFFDLNCLQCWKKLELHRMKKTKVVSEWQLFATANPARMFKSYVEPHSFNRPFKRHFQFYKMWYYRGCPVKPWQNFWCYSVPGNMGYWKTALMDRFHKKKMLVLQNKQSAVMLASHADVLRFVTRCSPRTPFAGD